MLVSAWATLQQVESPRIHQKHVLCATETPKLDSIHRQPRKGTNPIGCWTKLLTAHKICKSEGQVTARKVMFLDRDWWDCLILGSSRIFNCPPKKKGAARCTSSLAVFQPQLGVYILSCQRDVPSPSLTWNLKMAAWNRIFLLETIIFRFHVKLGEGNHHCIIVSMCWWAGDIVEWDRTDMDRSYHPTWPSQFSVPRMQKTGEDQMDEASRKHATCPRRHISTQLSPSGNTTKPRWIKFGTFQNATKIDTYWSYTSTILHF